MRVAVDDSRNHKLPRSVDHLRVFRSLDGWADFGNFSVFDQDGAVLDGTVRHSKHGGVLNQDHRGGVGGSCGLNKTREVKQAKEAEEVKEVKERNATFV